MTAAPFPVGPTSAGAEGKASLKDLLMRFVPAALALTSLFALHASVGHTAAPDVLDPHAVALEAAGKAALAHGDTQGATDNFEAALAWNPGSTGLVIDLAGAARAEGLQGKAVHYYRVILSADPDNLAAISGEGQALAEKGAIAKAQANLARLQALCGANCPETQALALVVAKDTKLAANAAGGAPSAVNAPMLAADAVKPSPSVSAN